MLQTRPALLNAIIKVLHPEADTVSLEPQYTRGILGQGCYLRQTLSKPGLLHCRLPALLVLQLMDFGRWQFVKCCEAVYIPESLSSEQNCLASLQTRISSDRAAIRSRLEQTTATATPGTDSSNLPMTADSTLGMMPLNVLLDCYWRADQTALEHSIMRLGASPDDALKKRLSRVLSTLLEQPADAQGSQPEYPL